MTLTVYIDLRVHVKLDVVLFGKLFDVNIAPRFLIQKLCAWKSLTGEEFSNDQICFVS